MGGAIVRLVDGQRQDVVYKSMSSMSKKEQKNLISPITIIINKAQQNNIEIYYRYTRSGTSTSTAQHAVE